MKRRLISLLLSGTLVLTGAQSVFAASGEELVFTEAEESEEEIFEEESEDLGWESFDENQIDLPEETQDESQEADYMEEILLDDSFEDADAASYFPEDGEGKAPVTGYRDLEHNMNIRSLAGRELPEATLMSEDENLPEYYVTPNLPPLRDQGNYGTCWAFSALNVAEINMMNNGELPDFYTPDYSRLHLAYFSYRFVEDPLGGTAGDYNSCFESGVNMLDLGGNVFLAENVLANWTGAASEDIMPYGMAQELNERIVDKGYAYDDMAHLQSYYDQAYDINDLDPIKNMIKEYGAVSMSFYAVNPFFGGSDASVYNARFNSYYNSDFNFANHAVAFVGWDDNFPKENFTTQPPADGAWLVRNSWKDGSLEDNQEYDGYFWMSYYEGSLYDYVHAFEFESADNYDNNYQYDGGMDVDTFYARKAANVFTSKAVNGAAGETLKAVGFYCGFANTDYEVSIYTNLGNPSEDPEDGILVSSASGKVAYAGFSTVKLDTPVILEPDTVFSVVVELKEQLYEGQEEDDRQGVFGYECEANSWYIVETQAEAGQSFMKPFLAADWEDFGKENNGNIKIKAYTTDNQDDSENATAPESIVFGENMKDMIIGVSESKKIAVSVLPQNATNKRLQYTSSDDDIVTVVNGYLYGKAVGSATITARAVLPDENGVRAESSFDVVVEPRLLGVTIDGTEDMEMGNEYTFTLKAIPKEAKLPEEPFWFSSDNDVVEIDSATGVAHPKEVGNALITALYGDEMKAFYVWVYPQSPVDLKARVDRFNTVTVTWEAGKGAKSYEVLRNGKVVKKISAFQGKTDYSFVDHTYKGNYESEQVSYVVRSVRKQAWICDALSVQTYEKTELDPDGGICDRTFAVHLPGEEPENLPVPYKKGYSFTEWEKISENQMKAVYRPNTYTVVFDPASEDAQGAMDDVICEYGSEKQLPKGVFDRGVNYAFAGWNTAADGSGKAYADEAVIKNLSATDDSVVTLYAQWEEAKRTVTFDTMGGSSLQPVSVMPGELFDTPDRIPVKGSCIFAGWYLDPDCEKACSFPIIVDEDITLYAKWLGEQESIKIEGTSKVLFTGSKEGREGYSLDLTASVLRSDGEKDENAEIIWTTSDPLVAGFLTESGQKPVSRTRSDGLSGNTVTVAIYSEDTDLDGYTDKWPKEGSCTYIYATSATDGAVYGCIMISVKNPESGNVNLGDTPLMKIMYEGQQLATSAESEGGRLDVLSGKEVQVVTVFEPEDEEERPVYYSSDNMAVATVSQDGKIVGKSAGTCVIWVESMGLKASFRVNVNYEITQVILGESSLKVGSGKTFAIPVAALVPSSGAGELKFESSDSSVTEFVELSSSEDGKLVGIFKAGAKGKAVITATAGSGSAKCKVTVGNPIESIEINIGKGMVAVDKTLKLTAKFNSASKKKPINKTLRWSVTDLNGDPTDKAVINEKTGKLTALKPGCIKVWAQSPVEGDSSQSDNNVIKIYVPVKKAALSTGSVSIKPEKSFEVALLLTGDSSEGLACTGDFDENGESIDILDMPEKITWKLKENDYADIEDLHNGRCRIQAGALESKGTLTLKATYLPFGAKKAKTLSCKVKVTNNTVSKIALSESKVTLGRGAVKDISAVLTPTAPEVAGVIWSIPAEYAKDICFMDGDTELEELQINTDLYEYGGNTVRIKARETADLSNKKVKLHAETVATNKKGVPYSANCTININGVANCIEFSDVSFSLQTGKSFKPKTVAYYVTEDKKTKAPIQKFNYKSSDPSVATVGKTSGKVTAVAAGTAVITATIQDGSGLTASFTVRVSEPVSSLTIDKASFYMGLRNDDAESEDSRKNSALASYNVLTPVALPAEAFGNGIEFSWSISNSQVLETAVIDSSAIAGATGVSDIQQIIMGLDNGSLFGKNEKITTRAGQLLALKAVATGTVTVTVTTSNGKKASCTVKVNAHVNGINVITDFGAIPEDGKTDNIAFNEAIKKAHENSKNGSGYTVVYVPGGTYDIEVFDTNNGSDMNTTGIHMKSGVSLVMDADAVLKVRGTGKADYGVIVVQGEKEDYGRGAVVPDNVVISGGQIAGERSRHSGSGGEGGHGIYLAGACNVTIADMLIHDNWGDGVYIGTRALFQESVGCRNITVRNCEIFNNRRNGISIVDLGTDSKYNKGLMVQDCLIRDSHGTAPQCGIYVEPNNKPKTSGYLQSEFVVCDTIYVKNTEIRAYQGKNDADYTCFMTHRDPSNSMYVTAKNITFEKCKIKGWFGNYSGQNLKLIDTSITGEQILGSNR